MSDSHRAPFSVVIPARFASSRLPGKPLLDLCGKPMIQWVWERARASGATEVIIATDDERIATTCRAFGAEAEMTAATHLSGTDRLAEVAARRGFADERIVINVQGDEPLILPQSIAALAQALHQRADCDIATPVARFESAAQWQDPNCVKAVRDLDGRALYFSRAPIPWPRDAVPGSLPGEAWHHIGLYAYRVRSLRQFAAHSPGALELIEKLEQLRALEHGMRIHLLPFPVVPPVGVDTPEDLQRVRAALAPTRRP
ncbi:MAG: 3-deoxy-manno-octulosonate cytidylyltransferase [Proteobacteria bacterium]|nr:3-deoxy-manno-octulosonate cytidylyltransferase [Pseudomonadota bacterium]